MRQLWMLTLILLLSAQLWGQASAVLDKITLSTGEVYVGQIVTQTQEMVMIRLKNGTRYQFQMSEIASITKTEATVGSVPTAQQAGHPAGNFCAYLETTAGISKAKYAFGTSPNIQASLTFGNKRVAGKNLFAGVGLGYNHIFSEAEPLSILPLFVRLQSTLSDKKIAPFVGMDAGYGFSLTPGFGGGVLVKASAGIIRRLNHKTSFIFGIYAGLNSITGNLTETKEFGTYTYRGTTVVRNFGAKVGLQF